MYSEKIFRIIQTRESFKSQTYWILKKKNLGESQAKSVSDALLLIKLKLHMLHLGLLIQWEWYISSSLRICLKFFGYFILKPQFCQQLLIFFQQSSCANRSIESVYCSTWKTNKSFISALQLLYSSQLESVREFD